MRAAAPGIFARDRYRFGKVKGIVSGLHYQVAFTGNSFCDTAVGAHRPEAELLLSFKVTPG